MEPLPPLVPLQPRMDMQHLPHLHAVRCHLTPSDQPFVAVTQALAHSRLCLVVTVRASHSVRQRL